MKIKEICEAKLSYVSGVKNPVLTTSTGFKALKVRVMGVVTNIAYNSRIETEVVRIEDGSGFSINLAYVPSIHEIGFGDLVDVIGLIKVIGNERFLLPELVIKVSDPNWFITRKLEIIHRLKKRAKKKDLKEFSEKIGEENRK